MDANLLLVCLVAFVAVFVLLSVLALTMRGLMAILPERPTGDGADPAVLAAITTATSAAFPGMQVKSVEEEKP